MSFFRLSGSYTELSSLTALDKPPAEEEKAEADDNAQTIRPGRSPQGLGTTVPLPVAKAPEPQIAPIAEDYSDLLFEEDEAKLRELIEKWTSLNYARCVLPLLGGLIALWVSLS